MADHLVYLWTPRGPTAQVWYGDHKGPKGKYANEGEILAMIPLGSDDVGNPLAELERRHPYKAKVDAA